MKAIRYTLFICALLIASIANAQITRISGTVSDDFDVLPGASVQEIDASNRIVNAAVTDMNGNFTMSIKSSKNKLKISFIGMKSQILPINKQVFKIKMSDNVTEMATVEIKAKKVIKTSGLAIPEREISFAAQGISAKDFEGLGITSVDEALQGRISGLDIVANSGNLGAGTQMRLRGASTVSTLTSNEPLIVVNGDIMSDLDLSDFDVSTATEEKFADLLRVNTEDILDIKVLKDGNAQAIWGVRGANGVIEITTKRGSRGPARVSYAGKLTANYQPSGVKLLNGDQYTMMLKEAYFNPALNDAAANIPELNYDYSGFSEAYMYDNNTNWADLVTQVGLRQNHYVSVTGGDEKTLFRISGGYDHETNSVIEQSLTRLSTRMALDYYVNDRIKIISDFSLTYTDNNRNYDDLLSIAYRKMPNLSPYYEYENGVQSSDYYFMLQNAAGGTNKLDDQKGLPNILASAVLATKKQRTYNLVPKLEVEYKLLGLDDSSHQLKYNGLVTINVSNQYDDHDYPRELSTQSYINTHSAYSYSAKSLSFTTRHTLNFVPKFKNEDHSMLLLGRFELTSGSNSNQHTSANRLPNGVTSPSAGGLIFAGGQGMGSGFGEWKSMSYLFSGHYAFKGRYSLDATIRMDGTTRFGEDRRWIPAPAVGARWNIVDEPWMEKAREKAKLSMLSIRPGWGRVGNQPNQDYLYMNKYYASNAYLGTTSMSASGFKLTNLSCEIVTSYNLGFDVGFFDDRVKLVLDLYSRTTDDMLMRGAGIPSSTGRPTLDYKNIGSMRNNGWEFNINGSRLARKGKFSLDFYVNFANNRNVITKMDDNILEGLNTDFARKNEVALQRVQIDNPFGSIYGFRYKGVYQYNFTTAQQMAKTNEGKAMLQNNINNGVTYPIALNGEGQVVYNEKGEPLQMRFCYDEGSELGKFNGGDAIYEDVNHDGQINELDIVYLGNSLPKLNGGFGFTLNYGHWRLATQFNYRLDYDIYNLARLRMENMNSNNNQGEAVNYRWRKEGDVTNIPRALASSQGENYNTLVSDRFIEDGTFLRLNYLQLSYDFDSKVIQKIHLTKLKLYASANNLFCLTKYSGVDPEISYGSYGISTDGLQTPRSRSFTFGLNVEF